MKEALSEHFSREACIKWPSAIFSLEDLRIYRENNLGTARNAGSIPHLEA